MQLQRRPINTIRRSYISISDDSQSRVERGTVHRVSAMQAGVPEEVDDLRQHKQQSEESIQTSWRE